MVKFDQPPEKKGIFARFRSGRGGNGGSSPPAEAATNNGSTTKQKSGKKVQIVKPDERESSPTLQEENTSPANNTVDFESERRVVTPDQSNNPQTIKIRKRSKLPFREEVALDKAPPACKAAWGGPPRYDWIDIETAAAIKVQAAYRRNKVMKDLEESGQTTAAIRNRSRRRGRGGDLASSEDVPGLFQCCGMGLAFGDTEEDYEEVRRHEKQLYEERKKARAQREAQLRSSYRRQNFIHKSQSNSATEAFEVLE